MRLVALAALSLPLLTACGADVGEACATDDDCAGDLVCHVHEGMDSVCEEAGNHDHDHDDTAAE